MNKLFLNGFVGSDINANLVREFLSNSKSDEVTIYINSPGGSVVEGIEIYNLIDRSPKNVTTVNMGMTASMGSIIFLAGDERIALDGSLYMIHNPSTISFGKADDLRKDADFLDKVKSSMENIYNKKTNLTDLSQMMDEASWFDVSEMQKYGITNSQREIIIDFDEEKEKEIEEEILIEKEPEVEDMGKIDDLKAELEKQKEINAKLEEEKQERDLQAQLDELKAQNEAMTLKDEANQKKDEVGPKDEANVLDKATAKVELIDPSNVTEQKNKKTIPAFMEYKSKY